MNIAKTVAGLLTVVGLFCDQGRRRRAIWRGRIFAKIKQVATASTKKGLAQGRWDGVRAALFTEDCVLLPPHGDRRGSGKRD